MSQPIKKPTHGGAQAQAGSIAGAGGHGSAGLAHPNGSASLTTTLTGAGGGTPVIAEPADTGTSD